MRVVILCIQFECLTKQRDIERATDTVVPGTFLFQIINHQLSSAGQQIIVLCQSMNRTIAFACRESQTDYLVGCEFEVETGCHKRPITTAVVGSDTGHRHNLVIEIVGILGIDAWRGFFIVLRQIVVIQ